MLNVLSVGMRLKAAFGMLLVMMGILSAVGIGRIGAMRADFERVAGNDMQMMQKIALLQVAVLDSGNAVRDAVAQEDLKIFKESTKAIAANRELAMESLRQIAAMAGPSEGTEKAAIASLTAAIPGLQKEIQTTLDRIDAAEYDLAKRNVVENLRPLQNQINAEVSALAKYKTEEGNRAAAAVTGSARTTLIVLIALTVIGTLAGLVMAWLIARSIAGPLSQAREFANQVSQGDLTRSIGSTAKDEVGAVMSALEAMRRSLVDVIGQIRSEGDRVSRLAAELEARTRKAQEQSREQNERIMAVSAAMEEMSVSIGEVSTSADGVRKASDHTQALTNSGNQTMQTTLDDMVDALQAVDQSSGMIRELAESFENIRGMANVIKEIADQTNLLALNAAIEAARAGEQGRGFAVVADEVRKLAERTTTSTADISRKVNEIAERAGHAVAAMEQVKVDVRRDAEQSRAVGGKLSEILDATGRVTGLANHIAEASQEQAAASQQTAAHMQGITALSEATRSAIEASGSTAHQLAGTAGTLQQLVARFRLAA